MTMPQAVNRLAKIFGWGVAWLLGVTQITRPSPAADAVWLRVSTPDFTVVTSTREKEAVAWAGDFAQFVAALREYFGRQKMRLPPLTIVVFARDRDFDGYRPLRANGKPQEVTGFFLRHESWAVAGLAGVGFRDGVRNVIFHEGVHWFMSLQERPDPVWLQEGLAEVFSTFNVVRKQAEWGGPIDNHVLFLAQNLPLPLAEVVSTARSDVFGDDATRTSIFYAESWAFVHYAIFGKHKMSPHALTDYAGLVHAGVPDAEAFRRAFGKTYQEMDGLLGEYLRTGEYFINRSPLAPVQALKAEPATAADVADALGRLALGGHHWPLAATHARAAITAAPDDPRGHEVLAMALKEQGGGPESLAEFGRAAELGSRDFRPYFELAAAAQSAAAGGESITPLSARRIANQYERAINLYPRFRPAYQNLAGVVGVAEPFGPQDRQFLEQGRRLFPDDVMIQVGLAALTHREGDRVAARALLDKLLEAGAGSAEVRTYAVRLDAAWESQDLAEKLTQLTEAKKFAEAMALIDERLARGVPVTMRAQLTMMRRQLQGGALTQSIQQSLKEKHWSDARRAIAELMASDSPPAAKAQARRSLEELDRGHLGLDGEAK